MADIELGPNDNGATRSVGIGDRVTVRLPESPTTGYRWTAVFDSRLVEQISSDFTVGAAGRGAGGQRIVVLRALEAGTCALALVDARSWSAAEGGDRFDVVLDIRAP